MAGTSLVVGDTLRIRNTRIGILTVSVLLLSCFSKSNNVMADPEPGPAAFYTDGLTADPENMHLLQRLRQLAQRGREINEQEREITEEAMAIEGILIEAKAAGLEGVAGMPHFSQRELSDEEIGEPLPIAEKLVRAAPRWDKRGSYMALCHFKICNMGRKRQLQ